MNGHTDVYVMQFFLTKIKREANDHILISPHHSLHIVASRCLHSAVHSTSCLSSRSRSCPPAVRYRYSRRSMLGATSCHNRPAQHRQRAHPYAWAAGTDGMTLRESTVHWYSCIVHYENIFY